MSEPEVKVNEKPKQPTYDEVAEMLNQMPKAEGFFGIPIEKFSQNYMKRIISWMSISTKQLKEQYDARIKMMQNQIDTLEGKNKKPTTKKAKVPKKAN